MSPFLKPNRKYMGIHVGPPKLTAPSLKEIRLVLSELQLQVCLHPRWPSAAILNDIKNPFDVHNPQTIPDLGVKFQTIWPTHFWEIAVHGSTDGRTYVHTDGGQIISPPPFRVTLFVWGLKICLVDSLSTHRGGTEELLLSPQKIFVFSWPR